MPHASDKTSLLIATLWQKNRPLVEERIHLLASGDPAQPEQYASMVEAAHKLSGALGMYGYPKASEVAAQLEAELRRREFTNLPALVGALRDAISG